ncbi:hypothetical protein Sjap_010922 [Stephania japonica]|uniref:F-box domain-containing protein n=1 Tax=Stephania japonica TaxID=461633 RepID=A0AAP0P6Y3_9MAGN
MFDAMLQCDERSNPTPIITELPDDVLHSIVRRLRSLVCFAAFRSVCKSWRSFFLQHYSYLVPPRPPWWMLPAKSNDSTHPTIYNLYAFDNDIQFYNCKIPDNCEMFIGSSGTWLIFIDSKGSKLQVWNPLSLSNISLPFLRRREKGINIYKKLIFSCTGPLIKNDADLLFGLVYNANNLAYMKFGDKEWTIVKIDCFPRPSTKTERIHDLVLYNGRFFFVNQCGVVFACEENAHAPCDQDYHYRCPVKVIKLMDPVNITSREKPTPNAKIFKYYLVEIKGKLMLVIRFSTFNANLGSKFSVFKLDFSKKKWEVVSRRDLEDFSLFLNGNYGTLAARVSGRNGIYFKTSKKVEETEVAEDDQIRNHKVMIYDYLKKNPDFRDVEEGARDGGGRRQRRVVCDVVTSGVLSYGDANDAMVIDTEEEACEEACVESAAQQAIRGGGCSFGGREGGA